MIAASLWRACCRRLKPQQLIESKSLKVRADLTPVSVVLPAYNRSTVLILEFHDRHAMFC